MARSVDVTTQMCDPAGIYRLSGVASSIKAFYVQAFLKRKSVNYSDFPVRSVTSAFKKYFRDLEVQCAAPRAAV